MHVGFTGLIVKQVIAIGVREQHGGYQKTGRRVPKLNN